MSSCSPRQTIFSKALAFLRTSEYSWPIPHSGCFNKLKISTLAASGLAASATKRIKLPHGVKTSGRPAESSILIPQRSNSAATRLARFLSGVTKAAVFSGVSKTSRIIKAIATASWRISWQSISCSPSQALADIVLGVRSRHLSVETAGRIISESSFSLSSFCDKTKSCTCSLEILRKSKSVLSSNCGWLSSILFQDSSSKNLSSPAKTISPFGNSATTFTSSRIEGKVAVVPAMIIRLFGLVSAQICACFNINLFLRSLASITPRSCKICGQ